MGLGSIIDGVSGRPYHACTYVRPSGQKGRTTRVHAAVRDVTGEESTCYARQSTREGRSRQEEGVLKLGIICECLCVSSRQQTRCILLPLQGVGSLQTAALVLLLYSSCLREGTQGRRGLCSMQPECWTLHASIGFLPFSFSFRLGFRSSVVNGFQRRSSGLVDRSVSPVTSYIYSVLSTKTA